MSVARGRTWYKVNCRAWATCDCFSLKVFFGNIFLLETKQEEFLRNHCNLQVFLLIRGRDEFREARLCSNCDVY